MDRRALFEDAEHAHESPPWHPVHPAPSSHPTFIRFCHPAHKNTQFLILRANDRTGNKYCIYHPTALAACQILAYNEPGFLSTSRSRNDAAPKAQGRFLAAPVYYYHLNNENASNYPICVDFDLWPFPHSRMPREWQPPAPTPVARRNPAISKSALSTVVKARDDYCCRITFDRNACTTVHIIPQKEDEWIAKNSMSKYGARSPGLHLDLSNYFVLCASMHMQFDNANFVIVPKDSHMVVYYIGDTMSTPIHHNQTFDDKAITREFLFARFAWSIIKMARESTPEPKDVWLMRYKPVKKRKIAVKGKSDEDYHGEPAQGSSTRSRRDGSLRPRVVLRLRYADEDDE